MVEVSCVCCVAVWLRYPFYIVWLYVWGILFVLCGCMVEAPFLYCVAVWLRYPFYIVWLYVWGTLFIIWLYGWGTLSYTVWLYVWGNIFVLCGSVVEVCCVCVYCQAVCLRYPFYIVWLCGWGVLFVLCGCMVEVSCLYCVAVMSWDILTSELKLYAVTGLYFSVRHPQQLLGLQCTVGSASFSIPSKFPVIIHCHISHLIHMTFSVGAMSVRFTDQEMKDYVNMV